MTPDTEHVSDDEATVESEISAKPSLSTVKETIPKRRTKTGCLTCRKRRIKCDEERPVCKNCIKSKRDCSGYSQPLTYKQHSSHPPDDIVNLSSASRYDWATGQNNAIHAAAGHLGFPTYASYPFTSAINGPTYDIAPSWHSNGNPPALQHHAPQHQTDFQHGGFESRRFQWSTPPQTFDALHRIDRNAGHNALDHYAVNGSNEWNQPEFDSPKAYNTWHADESLPSNIEQSQRVSGTLVETPSSDNMMQHHRQFVQHKNGVSHPAEADEDPNDPWDIVLEDYEADDNGNANSEIGVEKHTHGWRSKQLSAGVPTQKSLTRLPQTFVNSPLLDPKSRDIFEHFTYVTGPLTGLFELHESVGNVVRPRITWNHGLSAMAFRSPALAHAILAVGAIHMKNLNVSNENRAVKHFMYALRRLGNLLGDPRQRHQVPTLATVLILGYYEVMTGDHSRWNLHLSGAVKLLMEHDYAGMARTIQRIRARITNNISQVTFHDEVSFNRDFTRIAMTKPDLLNDIHWQADQKAVSRLTGYNVDYDRQFQSNFRTEMNTPNCEQRTLEEWKVLMDLFWWYGKQDVFMSMLSGDRLLLPYSQWRYCPPRGLINNPNTPNATLDHLWLLVARLADFGGRDRKRKQRVVNAQGGQWIPAPGFLDLPQNPSRDPRSVVDSSKPVIENQRRPSANESRARKVKQAPGAVGLSFYGMIPPANGPIQMPSSFNIVNAELKGGHKLSPTDSASPEAKDLDMLTSEALTEHAAIAESFDQFESVLGPDFYPLPDSDIQISTPFGPALQYRSPTIAVMWTFFLVGRILLQRMHPYSPPAAMVAAGVNAYKTHEYAQMIGRICGGLFAQHAYLLQSGHIDHALAAAVMETTLSLLFAAIQYQSPIQRGWTISKLNEVAQVMGWKTAIAVTAACESAWEAAGMAGKGPPYQRNKDQNNPDIRMSGNSEQKYSSNYAKVDANPVQEHESRFVSHDRNLIDKHASARAHWALGLLSMDEDLRKMNLHDDD